MPLEPFKKLQVTVMQAPPHHQAIPERNAQNERLPNPSLRVLILPLQDVYVDARVLVENRIIAKLASLQYATNRSLEDWLLIVKILVVIGSVDGIHFSPMRFHCSYRPDLVPRVCALSFRPDWDSRSSTIISMPLTSCAGVCLCYSGEEPALHVGVVGFIPKMSSKVHHQRSTPTRGRERSSSTSSFQERIFSPQSLFVRGNSHPVSKTWTIDDAGTSTSHSTTASFVASSLIVENLAMQNAMISAHSCGIKSLSLEALFKKLPVFTYDSNRLTYPFNALVSFNVTSEFHSLALSFLLVIFD
ncbi:hypothetical protein F2Q68_00000416 [Brassica cretica]|uniref:Uncharacterized protein n=1 Tax=Brassica cretica TaxID=69181 RepID=A0A8S9JF06_BRACR|nr:hypothetical protein F2Q68_00000416 [Brassica cretica]